MTRAEESLERLLAHRLPGRAPGADAAPGGEPGFVVAHRAEGAAAFRRLKLPTTRHEDWRFTSLAGLAGLELARPGPAVEPRAGAGATAGLPPAPRLVFVNGRHHPGLSDLAGLPDGAVAQSLADALARTPELVEPWLGRRARAAEHAFAGLNAALFEDGAFLLFHEGVRLERPLHLVHLASDAGGAAIHPRHVVVAGAGARAEIAEHYLGDDGAYLVNALTEVYAAAGAEVAHYRVQREGAGAFHVGLLEVEQGRGSRFHGHSLAVGAQLARVEARALLAAEDADCALEGLYLARGTQLHDHFVLVDHASPRCTSRELFKGVLDDHAHGVFSGKIQVRPGAQKTDASQSSSNLLLSEDAIADAKPQLEIDADDVKCSHGGTVGQLDPKALFYLRSRGVPERAARALLTYAFAAELVERVGPEALRRGARALVADRLEGGEALLDAVSREGFQQAEVAA